MDSFLLRTNKQTKRRERFEPPKNNTSKTRNEHIFSNKTHINNGRRIENEEDANETTGPTELEESERESEEDQIGEETRDHVRAEEKNEERRERIWSR